MRYIMLIASDEKTDIPYGTPEWDQHMIDYRAFSDEARRRNALIAGDPLQSVETATTLRMRGGGLSTFDGPYAETKEQLGGFYILECRDEAEALELAAMIPTAKHGAIEVRQMFGHETRYLETSAGSKYMVLIYGDEAGYLPPGDPQVMAGVSEHQAVTARAIESGEFVTGDGLMPPSRAKTVRVRSGAAQVTDGPFAETREQVSGFYIFACANLDRALALASQLPIGAGCLEIRPLLEV